MQVFRIREIQNVKNGINNAIAEHFQNYSEVYEEFKKFFNQEYLSEVIGKKSDLNQLAELDQIKADKTEITETKAIIFNLNQRVKQLAEVQTKLAHTLQNDKHSVSHYDHMTKKEFSK